MARVNRKTQRSSWPIQLRPKTAATLSQPFRIRCGFGKLHINGCATCPQPVPLDSQGITFIDEDTTSLRRKKSNSACDECRGSEMNAPKALSPQVSNQKILELGDLALVERLHRFPPPDHTSAEQQ